MGQPNRPPAAANPPTRPTAAGGQEPGAGAPGRPHAPSNPAAAAGGPETAERPKRRRLEPPQMGQLNRPLAEKENPEPGTGSKPSSDSST